MLGYGFGLGDFASLTIGADGFGLLAFSDTPTQAGARLNVIHCSNVFCLPNVRRR